jgi:hypothetical protein
MTTVTVLLKSEIGKAARRSAALHHYFLLPRDDDSFDYLQYRVCRHQVLSIVRNPRNLINKINTNNNNTTEFSQNSKPHHHDDDER